MRKFLLHSFQPYLCFGLAAVLLLTTSYPLAEESRPTESQVESAYLYNFGKFVTWPAGHAAASDLFEICVLGRDPFGTVLDSTVTGESIDGKKIAVRRLSTMQEAQPCNILYISSSEENRLAMILETAQRLNLLTVSNIKHFAGRGGTIGLVLREDKVRFEVNRAAAARSHLTLSSELLKVAVNIIEKNTPEVK
ncbi:MAG: YfiR family protein [Terriglobales bacterium]